MSRRDYYILQDGKIVPTDNAMTWARWFEAARDQRSIAQTLLPDDVRVSTVFLGLDHNFGPDGPPLILETMVFGGERDGEMERYSTLDEAKDGHTRMVAALTTPSEVG